MNFNQAIRSCFSKYATFQNRAPRSEFWYFALFTTGGGIVLGLLDDLSLVGPGVLEGLFSLIVFLPSVAVSVRRLHDLDKSGWWWLLWLVPVIGWIVMLIWMVSKGTEGENRFGPDPFDGSAGDKFEYTHQSSIPKIRRND